MNKTERLNAVKALMQSVCALLPHTNASHIWSDGTEILCRDEITAAAITDFIDALYGEETVNTGWYDPEEDAKEPRGPFSSTGFYYVTID